MTILTKSSSEKKGEKLVLPLVDNDFLSSAPPVDDVENQNPNIVILRTRARRVSYSTTLFLLIISLIVVGIGIVGGKILYDQYIAAQMHKFCGTFEVPLQEEQSQPAMYYSSDNNDLFKIDDVDNKFMQNDDQNNFDTIMRNYFNEDFEIDMDDESYEKIDVPDFRDGRRGRFIHDFNTNTTGIIDISGNRCFIMPLNRGNVLPPKSLYDLIHKMWEGYYKVDTKIVRESMRVVTPPLKDLSGVGTYIAKECHDRPVYKLEKYVGGVVKRSIENDVTFAQFSGKGIIQFNIIGMDDLKEYEKST